MLCLPQFREERAFSLQGFGAPFPELGPCSLLDHNPSCGSPGQEMSYMQEPGECWDPCARWR